MFGITQTLIIMHAACRSKWGTVLGSGHVAARTHSESDYALADAEAQAAGNRHPLSAREEPGCAGDRP
jgi:hypothetical protein